MPKNKGVYMVFRTKEELERHDRMVKLITQQQTLDTVTLALREAFRFTPAKYEVLDEVLDRKWGEVCDLFNEDVKGDKTLEYAKDVLDRALLEAVGEKLFRPHDERYSFWR